MFGDRCALTLTRHFERNALGHGVEQPFTIFYACDEPSPFGPDMFRCLRFTTLDRKARPLSPGRDILRVKRIVIAHDDN